MGKTGQKLREAAELALHVYQSGYLSGTGDVFGPVADKLREALARQQQCITCNQMTEVDPDIPASKMCLDCFIDRYEP